MDCGREMIVVSATRGTSQPDTFPGAAYRRFGNNTVAVCDDEYNRMLFDRMHSE